ncbi:MAG: hypothetical protein D6731_19805 [Planctomycetota bacterium]|nr:MAG: hypothetical protein D6731_19805 [Planctomycetota bacterium]
MELGLRAAGRTPFRPDPSMIVRVDPGPLIEPHPLLGYRNAPGRHHVTYRCGYSYTTTVTAKGTRATRPREREADYAGRPRIVVLGCSFTYGWSLADQDTYPWLLQQALPEFDVVNEGVAGYGTIHQLLRAKELLAARERPALIVATYGTLHDERNVVSRRFRKAVVPFDNQIRTLDSVRAFVSESGSVRIERIPLRYRPPPLIRRSALVEAMDECWNSLELAWLAPHRTTLRLLECLANACREAHVPLLLAGVWDDEATRRTLAVLAKLGVTTVDASVDLNDPRMNLLPVDWHPSAAANRVYAHRVLQAIRGLRGLAHAR